MPATNEYKGCTPGLQSPPPRVFLITPDNDNELDYLTRAISFAGAGTLKVIDEKDNTVTIPDGALAAGAQHSLRIKKVFATGTSATGIVGYS